MIIHAALALAFLAGPTGDEIPAHPRNLVYDELPFEVPDAASHRHQLSNGIPVYVAEDHALPLVDLSVTVRAGAFLDPHGKTGLASFTGAMLRRGGTAGLSAEEFDEELDFLAANVGSFTGDTSGGASLNCITQVLEPSMALFFAMLKTPGFDEGRLAVERDNRLEDMKQRNDDPAQISGREWAWLMRGEEHFSARISTKADLDSIGRDDMRAFHAAHWRPENMLITVAGDVDTEAILALLEEHFAGWSPEGPTVAWPPPAPNHSPTPGVYRVEKDIPQGRVVIGHLGLQRTDWDDPEAFALLVMNDILGGGGFTSRLVQRIRSDEGLAYSAGSSFGIDPFWPGVFSVGFQSKSATVALAAAITREEIERMQTELVTDEELRIAKNSFIEVFPRRFESAGSIVGTFAQDEFLGRPHGYWSSYRERIRAVTKEDVRAVAQKHLHPDQLVFLIVGNWAEIEPGDADGRASMAAFFEGRSEALPLRDPLTLKAAD